MRQLSRHSAQLLCRQIASGSPMVQADLGEFVRAEVCSRRRPDGCPLHDSEEALTTEAARCLMAKGGALLSTLSLLLWSYRRRGLMTFTFEYRRPLPRL